MASKMENGAEAAEKKPQKEKTLNGAEGEAANPKESEKKKKEKKKEKKAAPSTQAQEAQEGEEIISSLLNRMGAITQDPALRPMILGYDDRMFNVTGATVVHSQNDDEIDYIVMPI
ncbi:uncharacterized protein LOC118263270 [Spodoptera frugiperda]|uniref:Uncharacterized protein LOC118263270 n=1 Tax=Spodoptera frugiperda TaxID=7108 RepID=A0A9R0CW05_SPOFR|nr:uncharacterized protein LOC118263270 [Spodoptera frugiperda]